STGRWPAPTHPSSLPTSRRSPAGSSKGRRPTSAAASRSAQLPKNAAAASGALGSGRSRGTSKASPATPAGRSTSATGAMGGSGFNQVNYRVQKFVPAGGLNLTPEPFGEDEVQSVKVSATGGSFKLGMVDPQAARATGSFGSEQLQINNVTFNAGTFEVGAPV